MATGTAADYAAQTPQIWAGDLQSQAEFSTFWNRLEGEEGSAMPIQRRDDLTKESGDTIKFDLALALTGTGLSGDLVMLEGNEEKIVERQNSVKVSSLTHGVAWTKDSAIFNPHSFRPKSLRQLSKWLAGKFDDRLFAEFTNETINGYTGTTTIPTAAKWFAGSATTVGGIAATPPASLGAASGGTLTLRDLLEIKVQAEVVNKIEPMMDVNGEEYFGIVCHPNTILSLKRDDLQWAQAQRDARERGPNNPVFTGAAGMYDGVIIYRSPRVPVLNDGAGSIAVSRNIFFGANAMNRAFAYYPDWTEEGFSYGQRKGIATYTMFGQKLNVFDLTPAGGASAANLTALGSMVVYASAVAPVA